MTHSELDPASPTVSVIQAPAAMSARQLPDARLSPTRLQTAVWVLIVAGLAGATLYHRQMLQLGVMRDDAHYILLARSLTDPSGYGLSHGIGPVAPTHFPFGYPLLLAPLVAWLPEQLDLLIISSLAATVANCALLFWGWRRLTACSHWWGLAVTALYAWSPLVTTHARTIMSEPVFTFFVLLAILLVQLYVQGPGRLALPVLAFGVAPWVVFTRTAGWLVLAALAAYLLWARRRRALADLAMIGLGIGAAAVLVSAATSIELRNLPRSITGYSGNWRPFYDPAVRFGASARDLSTAQYFFSRTSRHVHNDLRELLLPVGGGARERAVWDRLGVPSARYLVGYGLLALVAIGAFQWIRQEGWTAFSWTAAGYLGLLLFWNWGGSRILYPVQPQLNLALLLGVDGALAAGMGLIDRAGRWPWLRRAGVAAFALAWIAAHTFKSLTPPDSRLHAGDVARRTAWLRANADPSGVILTEEPVLDYLYAGRKTVLSPECEKMPPDLAAWLPAEQVTYILVAPLVEWMADYSPVYSDNTVCLAQAAEALAAEGRLRLVYTSEPELIRVYQVP